MSPEPAPPVVDPRTPNLRVYPFCCTSAYCGRARCQGCSNEPTLRAFKAWVARAGARVENPVWCPLVYTAASGE